MTLGSMYHREHTSAAVREQVPHTAVNTGWAVLSWEMEIFGRGVAAELLSVIKAAVVGVVGVLVA